MSTIDLAKRVFHKISSKVKDRKLIIISDDKVINYTIGSRFQWVVGIAGFGTLAWLAYSTGTTIAYKEIAIRHAEALTGISFRDETLERQYLLTRLADTEDALFASQDQQEAIITGESQVIEPDEDSPAERIAFLEGRVEELENYNQRFLDVLEKRTQIRISQLEKALSTTGLDVDELGEKITEQNEEEKVDGQGGPYEQIEGLDMGSREQELIDNVSHLVTLESLTETLPLTRPIPNGRITSGFGARKDPFTKRWARHSGMDFAGPYNAKVLVTADGTVTFASRNGAYGRMVEIDHGLGITTRYGHLRKILVKKGQKVSKGDVIGRQGNSGRSTGAHLHYEVRYNDKALDPKNFLKAGEDVYKD